jgi:hypothetical protein
MSGSYVAKGRTEEQAAEPKSDKTIKREQKNK